MFDCWFCLCERKLFCWRHDRETNEALISHLSINLNIFLHNMVMTLCLSVAIYFLFSILRRWISVYNAARSVDIHIGVKLIVQIRIQL